MHCLSSKRVLIFHSLDELQVGQVSWVGFMILSLRSFFYEFTAPVKVFFEGPPKGQDSEGKASCGPSDILICIHTPVEECHRGLDHYGVDVCKYAEIEKFKHAWHY